MATWTGKDLLAQGSQGAGVKELQDALTALGYNVGKTGSDSIFGPDTESALKAFQKAAGIDVDAIAGPDTYAALQAGLAKLQAPQPSSTAKPEVSNTTVPATQNQTSQPIPVQSTAPQWLDGMIAVMNQSQTPSGIPSNAMAPYEQMLRDILSQ